jgi:hypothetical protein
LPFLCSRGLALAPGLRSSILLAEHESVAGPEAGLDASRATIGFGQKGRLAFHETEFAQATHLYLLTTDGKMVKYIDPSISPGQFAECLVRPAKGGDI